MGQKNEMVKLAITALEDKKREDIRVIDIHEVSVLADYFLNASGSNGNQVQAMADNVGRGAWQSRIPVQAGRRLPERKLDFDGLWRYHRCTYSIKRAVCFMILNVSGEID